MEMEYHNRQHPMIEFKSKILFNIEWDCPGFWQMCILKDDNKSVTYWL